VEELGAFEFSGYRRPDKGQTPSVLKKNAIVIALLEEKCTII
jgi:hypothetical protein